MREIELILKIPETEKECEGIGEYPNCKSCYRSLGGFYSCFIVGTEKVPQEIMELSKGSTTKGD